jgi:molybdopterin/thiamine biosynthesis adenylyltransferase
MTTATPDTVTLQERSLTKYVLVGAGGTGSHFLAPFLSYIQTQDNPWELRIVDGDDVEVGNLTRQLFNPLFVGMNKARALTLPYEQHRNITAIPVYLDENNIANIIEEGSTVFIAVDNYPVRALIEGYCQTLSDCAIINGGNEFDSGTCQIYLRKDGENLTPKLSYMHPEISLVGKNRSDMSCSEIAALPGGEQLIVANMSSATHMLNALMMIHRGDIQWTEMAFNLSDFKGNWARDNRKFEGWR